MFELIRIVLLLLMLGITSYFDIKHREVSDKYWLIFGVLGIVIYFFDWQEHTSYDGLTIIITLITAAIMWKIFPIGKADILAFVCIGILMPTMAEFIMMPIALFAGSAVIAAISVILYNVILNTLDGYKIKLGPFYSFDEPLIRKLFAFFMIHRKRKRERFSICAENSINGNRKFCLGVKNVESEFVKDDDVFVECGTPLLPYMLAVYMFLIVAIT